MIRIASGAAAALAVLVLAACAPGGDEAGFGLPVLSPDEARTVADSAGASFSHRDGSMRLAGNGCFHWASDDEADGAWIVWPEGYRHDGGTVIGSDGAEIGDGDPVGGMIAAVALPDLPDGGSTDSYFGSFGRFCGADEVGVVVLGLFEG